MAERDRADESLDRPIYTRGQPVLLPSYPRHVYLTLKDEGFDDRELFENLGFGPEELDDEKFRLSIEQHEQFILRVLELAGDPRFWVRIWRGLAAAPTNIALLAATNSGTVSEALQLITRYNKLFTRVFSTRLRASEGRTVMEVEPHVEHDSVIFFALGSFLLFIDGFFRKPLKGASLVERAELAVPEPEWFDAIDGDFGIPVTFEAPRTRIHFVEALLDEPLRRADPQTVRMLTEMSERQLEEANAEDSLAGRVSSLLMDHIGSPPKLDEAARVLGVSPRGLRRKLAEHDTTYGKLLDAVRLKAASRLLKETDAPVSSIAYELGFENPSDFTRAFKRWTGRPPSSLRP